MKTAKLTLMFLACAAALPAMAQNATESRCGMTNYDASQNFFTIVNPAAGAVNQQCFITVVAPQYSPNGQQSLGNSEFVAGNYEITYSGGGGGGGGGRMFDSGGGGAGAIPAKETRYLAPGVYRLTIGTAGQGGTDGTFSGQRGGDGAPTSLSNATTGQTIAGFPGAENWDGRNRQNYNATGGNGAKQLSGFVDGKGNPMATGDGGAGVNGQAYGGDGGHKPHGKSPEEASQDGGTLTVAGVHTGVPGKGGRNDGGGGGGAGYGNGSDGKTSGDVDATLGGKGGNGFIMLRPLQLAQAAVPPAPVAAPAAYVAPAPVVTRPAKKDRN